MCMMVKYRGLLWDWELKSDVLWEKTIALCFSWVFYEDKQYSGNLYVLSEGDYPNLTSMGCPPGFTVRSIKVVPTVRKHSRIKVSAVFFPPSPSEPPPLPVQTFSVPSISLFGLECLEGREITTEAEILSMVEEGFNDHILSVRVNSGWWEFVSLRLRVFAESVWPCTVCMFALVYLHWLASWGSFLLLTSSNSSFHDSKVVKVNTQCIVKW